MPSLAMSINCRVIFSSPRSNIFCVNRFVTPGECWGRLNDNNDRALLAAADSVLRKPR